MGESTNPRATLRFDRRVRLEFRGATITSDAGLLACRELDDALGLTETANECLQESRGGRNVQHRLVGLLRQSVYSRLAGYEDTNDAERLAQDPTMRVVVGRRGGPERPAASTNTMSRFETEVPTATANPWISKMSLDAPSTGVVNTPSGLAVPVAGLTQAEIQALDDGRTMPGARDAAGKPAPATSSPLPDVRGRPIEDVDGAAETGVEVQQQDAGATMLDPNMTEALAESGSTSDPRTSAEPDSLLDTDDSMEDGFRDAGNDNPLPLPVETTETVFPISGSSFVRFRAPQTSSVPNRLSGPSV